VWCVVCGVWFGVVCVCVCVCVCVGVLCCRSVWCCRRSRGKVKPGQTMGTTTSKEDFEEIRPLGSGGFGKVILVREKVTGLLRALKKVHTRSGTQKDMAMQEGRKLFELQHPNIVKAYSFYNSHRILKLSHEVGIVMEYCDYGDLSKLICPSEPLAEREILVVMVQTCAGLLYLHTYGVLHRDLKPENLMLQSYQLSEETAGSGGGGSGSAVVGAGIPSLPMAASVDAGSATTVLKINGTCVRVKIGDLGIASILRPMASDEQPLQRKGSAAGERKASISMPFFERRRSFSGDGSSWGFERLGTDSVAGTSLYMAPEISRGLGRYSYPSDIYSLGLILGELILGNRVWAIRDMREAVSKSSAVSSKLRGLCVRMLANNPLQRPKVQEVLDTSLACLHDLQFSFLPPLLVKLAITLVMLLMLVGYLMSFGD
jgi:serine/threonine protein kinase